MLSQKSRYAIRALQHLADIYPDGLARMADIADAQNIPSRFLSVILSELRRHGVVASQRGREGGHRLALAPSDILYGDIIRLTEGSLALVPCANRLEPDHCVQCVSQSRCRLRLLMRKVHHDTEAVLNSISLADDIAAIIPNSHSR